jgi:hypothetical protein
MKSTRRLDLVWILLISLTLGGAALGDAVAPGFWVTVAIAGIMGLKGRMVIDHFMELAVANRTIRWMVRLYAILMPLLLILTSVFGAKIASLTRL